MFFFANAQQRLVLYEEFSGENCGPCAATNPGLWALLNDGTNPSKVMLIKYQTPIPSAGPIYFQNTADVDNRANYYSVPFAPYARMDGDVSPGAPNSTNAGHPGYLTQALINAATAVASPFTITVNNSVTGTNLTSNISVTANAAYSGTSVKLRAALVETLIYTSPPGTNGEMEFHHVVRKMYPSADGQTIPSTWTAGQNATYNFTGAIPTYVDRTHELFVVVWIQNDGDKKIAQAAKSAQLPAVALDATVMNSGATVTCGSGTIDHKVKIKNTGTAALTQATLYYKIGSGAYQAGPTWSGNLAAGQTSADFAIGALTISGATTIRDSIGLVNNQADLNPANNATATNFAANATAAALPHSTGFEGAASTAPPTGYMIFDKNGGVVPNPAFNAETWFRHSEDGIVGQAGSAFTCITNAANMSNGATTVITFPYTAAAAGAKAVDFYYSYAQRGTVSGDKLDVVYSTDCGQNWTSIWNKSGADLATAPAVGENSLFFPTQESHWKFASVDATAVSGNVLLGFRATSGGGNLILIDNVQFRTGSVTGIEELVAGGNATLYPNPVSDMVNVELNLVKSAQVTFTVVNVMGQQVGKPLVKSANAGQNITSIATSDLAPGIYFLNIATEKGNIQQKFIKK